MSTYKELADTLKNLTHNDIGFYAAVDEAIAILLSLDAHPVFWYRPTCGGEMYEGPFHSNSRAGKILRDENPDEWKPLYAAPVAAQPTKHYRTLRGNWTNTTTHVCNFCGFETRSEHSIVAHQCNGRKAAQPQQGEGCPTWKKREKGGEQ